MPVSAEIAIECDGCHQPVGCHEGNTVVYTYWYQPWFAYGQTLCNCMTATRLFFGPKRWQKWAEDFTELGVGFVIGDYAPYEVVKAYTEVFQKHIHLLQPKHLTAYEDGLVGFFCYLLDKGEDCA
jgi:hypothetical protein